MFLRWRGVRELRTMACGLVLLAGVLSWSGCGVKSTASSTPIVVPPITPGSGATTPILLTLTDDTTSDGIVSFYANISQVQITPRSGSDATLYSSTSTLEMMHSAGSTQYLTMTGLSQNSYKNIIVTITDPLITYIDSTGATVTEEFPNYSGSAEADFSSLVNVDGTPLEITLDFNLEKSVVLDPVTGAMTLTPVFTATANPINVSAPGIGTGLLETVLGNVSQYANGVLTLNTALSCNITSATTPVNYTASAGLPRGALVRVDMAAQLDSSMNCVHVEAVNSSSIAYAMAGTVNSFRGSLSPYQLTLDMQEGTGAGVSPQFIGRGINVDFYSTTNFAVDWDGMDQTNLGFTPVFSPASFFPAQYVEASSSVPLLTTGNDIGAIPGSMITVAAMNAAQITLRKQEEEGSVSNVATDGNGVTRFTLTLDPGSVFAQYTALPVEPTAFVPTINAVVPAGATIDGSLTAAITGAPAKSLPYVKVRGLLFLNGGTYTLVAQRVTATLPPS